MKNNKPTPRTAEVRLAPGGTPPGGRYAHSTLYDPARDRMIVFGGRDNSASLGDVWALALGDVPAWSQLAPGGTPPGRRYAHGALYDPVRDRMVIFAGKDDSSCRNDVWALALAGAPAWNVLSPVGEPPGARYLQGVIYDPGHDRMVVFGGQGYAFPWSDTWALSLAGIPAWDDLAPAGGPPRARGACSAVYDSQRHRMVVFGGADGFALRDDAWALSLVDAPAWSPLALAGTPPSARNFHAAIYDAEHDRMIVFGGADATALRNDVWALSLTGVPAWSQLAPTGTPPDARAMHTAIYDPPRRRMVVFGGQDGSAHRRDVWALSLGDPPAWTQLVPAGELPSPRDGHVAVYDPQGDRMIVFGGHDDSSLRNDVWALSLGGFPAWTQQAPTGTPPGARYLHAAVHDLVRGRMVAFGGQASASLRDDAWALSLDGPPAWTQLSPAGAPPDPRCLHGAVYDPLRDRMVVFSGFGDAGPIPDLWALVWGVPVAVPGDSAGLPAGFALGPARPNPGRGAVAFDFALPTGAGVAITIHDVAGRTVRELAAGFHPPGRHSVVWDQRDRNGSPVPSGVYFARLRAAGVSVTHRTVLLQ